MMRVHSELATSRRLIAALVNEALVACIAETAHMARLAPRSAAAHANTVDLWVTLVADHPDVPVGTPLIPLDPDDIAAVQFELRAGPDVPRQISHPADVLAVVAPWLDQPQDTIDRLVLELSNSVDNQELAFSHRQPSPTLRSPAIAWEQAITEGHPSHPLHRAKIGLDRSNVMRWSSEFGGGPDLLFVALPRDHAVVLGSYESTIRPWLPRETIEAAGPSKEWIVIPVHPGQLTKILELVPEARRLPGSCQASAQTSIRTVVPKGLTGYHLKLSLAVHTTSAVRTISPQSVNNGPLLTGLLRPIIPDKLFLIGEPAAAAYKHPDDAVAKHLACVVRDDPEAHLPEEHVIVSAALIEKDKDGVPLVIRVFGLDTREKRLQFFDRYTDIFLSCFLPPLRDFGVAFEAHGQNVLLRVDQDGNIIGFAVRDFGGVKLHLPTLDAKLGKPTHLHPGSTITAESLYEANAKLFHTAVQHHLHHLLRALGLHFDGSGWSIVRHHAKRHLTGTPFWEWWLQPRIAFKGLFSMRLANTPYDSIFIKLDNVLLTPERS